MHNTHHHSMHNNENVMLISYTLMHVVPSLNPIVMLLKILHRCSEIHHLKAKSIIVGPSLQGQAHHVGP